MAFVYGKGICRLTTTAREPRPSHLTFAHSFGNGAGWRGTLRFVLPAMVFALSLIPLLEIIRLGATMPQFLTSAPHGAFALEYFYTFFGENVALAALAGLPVALIVFAKLHRWATSTPSLAASGGSKEVRIGSSMLLIMIVVGLALHYVVSLTLKPMLFHRYTMYWLPLYLALIAIGFEMIIGKAKRVAFATLLVAMSFWVLLVTKNHYQSR